MGFILLGTAGVESLSGFFNKKLVIRGMTPIEFFYYITLALIPLSAILFLFYPFSLAISFTAVMLILSSAVVRAVSVVVHAKALKTVTPLSISIFSSIAVLITYVVDVLIGAISFNIWHLLALLLVTLGCLIIILKNLHLLKGVKTSVILRVVTEVLKGYLAYFSLKYINNGMYIFLIATITSIAIIPFTKKMVSFNKKELFNSLLIQILGVINLALMNILASSSATLYMLKAPAILVFTLFLSYIVRKDVGSLPNKQELLGSLVVITGLVIFSVLQIY